MPAVRHIALLGLAVSFVTLAGVTSSVARGMQDAMGAMAVEPTTAPAENARVAERTGPDAEETETPTTKPARRARAARLTQPYSLIADSLTEEQKQQITAIHAEAVEKIHAIQADEEARCAALLTDEQKAAMQEAADAKKAQQKAKK